MLHLVQRLSAHLSDYLSSLPRPDGLAGQLLALRQRQGQM